MNVDIVDGIDRINAVTLKKTLATVIITTPTYVCPICSLPLASEKGDKRRRRCLSLMLPHNLKFLIPMTVMSGFLLFNCQHHLWLAPLSKLSSVVP